mmetsp:Transcript_5264/g.8146  ORF Transcript_5264/g.8146 Transcript_5264/m.8146 type:complete len:169 (+) Transcript_5264:847-1353(+)
MQPEEIKKIEDSWRNMDQYEKKKEKKLKKSAEKVRNEREGWMVKTQQNLKLLKFDFQEKYDDLHERDTKRDNLVEQRHKEKKDDITIRKEVFQLKKFDQEENLKRDYTMKTMYKKQLVDKIKEKKERADHVRQQQQRIAHMCKSQRDSYEKAFDVINKENEAKREKMS